MINKAAIQDDLYLDQFPRGIQRIIDNMEEIGRWFGGVWYRKNKLNKFQRIEIMRIKRLRKKQRRKDKKWRATTNDRYATIMH